MILIINQLCNALWKFTTEAINKLKKPDDSKYFDILKSMDAIMRPGELTVVLGRPGAGCSTLLKTIAVNTYGFHIGKESQITYDGLSHMILNVITVVMLFILLKPMFISLI